MGMDIVVTTPHGDADIDVVAAPTGSTLADLIGTVTGQSPPATARVDGRSVPSSRPLHDVGLVIGSVVDTHPVSAAEDRSGAADLLQLAGRGAGTRRRLSPGRYRIGPARSSSGDELEIAAVETSILEIDVAASGEVHATAEGDHGLDDSRSPRLDGKPLARRRLWSSGHLTVAGRRFQLERTPTNQEFRDVENRAENGSIPFRRRPNAPTDRRTLIHGARRDAASAAGQLWQWRPGDRGAFEVAYGFEHDTELPIAVDLLAHQAVALVGSERFRSALARTLLVELCTMHGPAHLDIVIATRHQQLADWSWARWIPHIRGGRPNTPPRLFAHDAELAAWANEFIRRPSSPTTRQHLTALVVDSPALWGQRNSPIHPLLADPPDDLRIVALCAGVDDAPTSCSELLVESRQPATSTDHPELRAPLVTHHRLNSNSPTLVSNIEPALVETDVALEIARHLAPLDDLEAEPDLGDPRTVLSPTLFELVGTSITDGEGESQLAVAIGVAGAAAGDGSIRRSVSIELSGPLSTIITADDPAHHDEAVAAIVLGAASQRRPEELAIVILSSRHHDWHDLVPHIAGSAERNAVDNTTRLVHRVARVATERPELHLLIVVEHAFDRDHPPASDMITAMNELAVTFSNVHIIWSGDHPSSVSASGRSSCGALAWVTASGDSTVWFPDRSLSFQGIRPTPLGSDRVDAPQSHASRLIVRPTLQSRPPTPLERRLERAADPTTAERTDESAATTIARQLDDRYGGQEAHRGARPTLIPPALPIEVEASALFADNAGDAIPIGLVDRPERADHDISWWQPGRDGSVLAVGSPRSAMTSLVDVLAVGVAARFSPEDLHLYAIEAPGERRRALEALPHLGDVVDPDASSDVAALISGLRAMLAVRLQRPTEADRPDVLLLISDLGRMRRALPPDTADSTFDQLGELIASGAWVGVNVVVVANRVDDLRPLDQMTGNRLVGPMSDPDDRSRLGVGSVDAADRHPRRCWSTALDRHIQLAAPPADIVGEIQRLAPESARVRPAPSILAAETT